MFSLRRVIAFLLHVSRDLPFIRLSFTAIILMGVVSGLSNTVLIALVNDQIHQSGDTSVRLWWFAGLCVVVPLTRFGSSILLVHLSQRATYQVRMQLCRKILRAPLRQLEELRPHRLLASITDDVGAISGSLVSVPRLSMYVAIVLGCLGYLAWLSLPGLGVVVAFVLVGAALYRLPMIRAGRKFDLTREYWDGWFNGLKALTEGTKELKLHRERRRGFERDGLGRPLGDMLDSAMAGNAYATAAASFGQVVSFLLIGIVVFFLPRITPMDDRVLTGYALTILYMVGPLEGIMNLVPSYRRAQTAVKKVEDLGLSLADEESGEAETEDHPDAGWRRLELQGVTHTYRDEASQDTFTLGPVDLALTSGELVFLVGGNGSGKTTLAKMLLGLYAPEEGRVLLDGRAVGDDDRDTYRQLFTAIFGDFFLFESFFGLESPTLKEEAERYLERLQLSRKVGIEDEALTTLDLSQGQRKRLALLIAYLEDRSIYLFDEWAADQDPYFKEVFYRELLPELKERGKTVIVISHDDRYFHLGDRLVKMESGRIVYDGEPIAPEAAALAAPVGAVAADEAKTEEVAR